MEDWPRYRIVSSLSPEKLHAEVQLLKKQGWAALGEPALAIATRPDAPPYWVQTLYRSKELPPVFIVSKPPTKPARRTKG